MWAGQAWWGEEGDWLTLRRGGAGSAGRRRGEDVGFGGQSTVGLCKGRGREGKGGGRTLVVEKQGWERACGSQKNWPKIKRE